MHYHIYSQYQIVREKSFLRHSRPLRGGGGGGRWARAPQAPPPLGPALQSYMYLANIVLP